MVTNWIVIRWDDFIVGAPIYSEQLRKEIGRIFVYWNNEVINIFI